MIFHSIGYICGQSPEADQFLSEPVPPGNYKTLEARTGYIEKAKADRVKLTPFCPIAGRIEAACLIDGTGKELLNGAVTPATAFQFLKWIRVKAQEGFLLGIKIDRFIDVLTFQVMKSPDLELGYSPVKERRELMERCIDPYTYVLRKKEYRDYVSLANLLTWLGVEIGDYTSPSGTAQIAFRLARAAGMFSSDFVVGNYEFTEHTER